MFGLSSKKKRKASSSTSSTPSLTVLETIYDCHAFLSPNEHAAVALDLLTSILRPAAGEVFFSEIMNEVEKKRRSSEDIASCFLRLLEQRRENLPERNASIEKCHMLTRMITYIRENTRHFNAVINDIRDKIVKKMTDDNVNLSIERLFEEFEKRKRAQEQRRQFYLSDTDAHEPKNVLYLQKRMTACLNDLIEGRMKFDLKTLKSILNSSFMIIVHPHCDGIPVTVHSVKTHGEYTIRLKVKVVSLLHDFMETHPGVIVPSNIKPYLLPASDHYRLEASQELSWNICELRNCVETRPRRIRYAESKSFTIELTAGTDVQVHLSAELHRLALAIQVQINIPAHKISESHNVTLQTLPFGIDSNNVQIPHTLTQVILDDIRRFAHPSNDSIQVVANYVQRYFVYRTGIVIPSSLKMYVEDELKRAKNERWMFDTLEDIFMDFLVPFVHQVEFLVKYPLLAMLITDGLCLGICDSTKAAHTMRQICTVGGSMMNLRLNSLRIDYQNNATKPIRGRAIKLSACAVRVDIYQHGSHEPEYYTFDSERLMADISSFITTSYTDQGNHKPILSTTDEQSDRMSYQELQNFTKYYDADFHGIRTSAKYRPLMSILYRAQNTNQQHENSKSVLQSTDNILPAFDREAMIQYILFNPELASEIIHRLNATSSSSQLTSTAMLSNELLDMDIAQYLSTPSEQTTMNLDLSSAFNDLLPTSSPTNQT